jgi:hypothetical protein
VKGLASDECIRTDKSALALSLAIDEAFQFILVCPPDSHKTLYEHLMTTERLACSPAALVICRVIISLRNGITGLECSRLNSLNPRRDKLGETSLQQAPMLGGGRPFSITIHLIADTVAQRNAINESLLRDIIEQEKPAFCTYTLTLTPTLTPE